MKNKMFVCKNDGQDQSLTGQVCDQAGHKSVKRPLFSVLLAGIRVHSRRSSLAL